MPASAAAWALDSVNNWPAREMSVCGVCQACTACRLACRRLASSSAKASASRQLSVSATPTPMSPCGAGGSSRMTTTGLDAWLAAYRLTEPSSRAVNAPVPREPSTSISAPAPLSVTACAVGPVSSSVSISTPAAALAARSAAMASARSRSSTRTSVTVSYSPALVCGLIRGSSPAVATIRSGAPRRAASLAAQPTARSDSSEPSVPATMGFDAMARPLLGRVVLGRVVLRARRSRTAIMTARPRVRLVPPSGPVVPALAHGRARPGAGAGGGRPAAGGRHSCHARIARNRRGVRSCHQSIGEATRNCCEFRLCCTEPCVPKIIGRGTGPR